MTSVQSTLDAIEAVLAECDATTLPPISGPNVVQVEAFVEEEAGFELSAWQRQWFQWIYGRQR